MDCEACGAEITNVPTAIEFWSPDNPEGRFCRLCCPPERLEREKKKCRRRQVERIAMSRSTFSAAVTMAPNLLRATSNGCHQRLRSGSSDNL